MADDSLDRFDAAVGDGIERAMIHHHMRRMRRHGQLGGARPGERRAVGADRRAAAPRQRARDPDRRRERAAADGRGDPRRAAPRPRLLVEPPARLRPRPAQVRRPVRELLAETAERVPVRVIVWAGAPVPVFQPRRGVVKAAREELVRGTKIQCQLDACTADAALPPREARDRRRRAGVRRRHRPDRAGRRPLRLQRRTRTRRTRSAGTTRRAAARPDRARRRRPLRAALGGDRGRGAPAPGGRRRPAGDTTVQFVRTVPEGAYRVAPARRVLGPRVLRPRAALRAPADLPREPVPVVARDRRTSSRPSCATRRRTTSASSSCSRTRPTTARTTRAGCSAGWSPPTTAASASWPRRSCRAPASARARSTCTRRSASSTTSGSRSARPTSTSTRSSTTPRSTSSPATPALARATRLRLWEEHLERGDVDGDPARVVDELWRPIASEQLERQRAGRAAHAPPRRAPRRVAPVAAAARAARRARRRRLRPRRRRCGCRARAPGPRGAT